MEKGPAGPFSFSRPAAAAPAPGRGVNCAPAYRSPTMSEILVPVSFAELLDKIAILQTKSGRMSEPAELANVRKELEAPEATWAADPASRTDIWVLRAQL